MQWFIIEAANRPGELARHTEAVAKHGINLSGLISLGIAERGGLAFYATDEAGLRTALNQAGVACREVSTIAIKLEDKPGAAASAARSLADAGVNIELFAPVGMSGQQVTVAIGVDKVEEARKALGNLVTDWTPAQMAGSTG